MLRALTHDLSQDEQLAFVREVRAPDNCRVQPFKSLIQAAAMSMRSHLTFINLSHYRLSCRAIDPSERSCAENAQGRIHYLIRLIDRVQLLAELDAQWVQFNMAPVKLNRLARYIQTSTGGLAEAKGIGLTIDLTDEEPVVKADELQLYRVVEEVATNAIQYTAEGGSVTVRTFNRDGYGILEVRDTGTGIAPEFITQLFDRSYIFNPAPSVPGKLGLGLAIAKRIIDAHDGRIDITSEPDKGATVSISIPLVS